MRKRDRQAIADRLAENLFQKMGEKLIAEWDGKEEFYHTIEVNVTIT